MSINISNVLVVDDEPLMREFVGETLTRLGCEVQYAQEGIEAIRVFDKDEFDLVITDMKLPKLSGIDVLKHVKENKPSAEVVVMTAYGTVETAVEAMKIGAFDYLMKPFSADQVELLMEKISSTMFLKAENAYLRGELESQLGGREIIGQSTSMKEIYGVIEKVSTSKASVLISGKSGTGKELAARALHYLSPRRDRPFVKLNCAALPSNLIESELFGHERGAFTGAHSQRIGRFELAHKGTIFLDEISEMDLSLQAKLLRVLQEKEFERVGSSKTISVDVRVLASTNRDLKEEIKKGAFREDLYYRLNVVPLKLPPLKDRSNDILLLANFFLEKFSRENGVKEKAFSPKALQAMEVYPWPGNVRELENVIERAVVLDRDSEISASDLGLEEGENIAESHSSDEPQQVSSDFSMKRVEKEHILKTLRFFKGNRTRTAEALEISIRTLRNKINEYRQEGTQIPDQDSE